MKAQSRLFHLTITTLLITLFLTALAGIFAPAPAQATTGFVTRSGTNFMLNGSTYYFAGTNNYYLIYKSNYMVDDLLVNAANNNFKVIRAWGFLDIGNQDGSNSVDGSGIKDGVYFQYWNGSAPAYNDGPNGIQKLDYVIWKAGQLNLRLIIPFTNNWRDFGGMDQYVRWHGGGFHDDFYSNATIKQWYKNYISHLVNRVNPLTGVAYKNDPAIMAWELGNEPRCQGSGTYGYSSNCNTTMITSWVSEMSAYIQGIDTNHLVAVGDEGFYCIPNAPDWTDNCGAGVDTVGFTNVSTIDFMGFHLYADAWGHTSDWGTTWITRHITDGHAAGKPVMLGEYGQRDQGTRNTVYQTWTNAINTNGGDGDLFWMLAAHQDDGTLYPDYDSYTIYCPSTFCSTLAGHASAMSNKSGIPPNTPAPTVTRPPTATNTATPCGCPTPTFTPTGPTPTRTNTPPPTPTAAMSVVDDLNDFSKTFAHTANLAFDNTNTAVFNGDTSRLMRTTKTVETVTWNLTGMNQFKAVTYHWPFETVSHFVFYTSPNNTTYTPITPIINNLGGDWIRIEYTFNPPAGTNYVKVEFPNTAANNWNPQISQVVYGGSGGPTPTPGGPTNTPTNTPIPPTATFTPTNTPVPPTNTPTNTAGPTNTPTNTSPPPTNTPTRTNTPIPPTNTTGPSPTPTNTSLPPTNTPTRTNTPVPPPTNTAGPTPTNSGNFRVDANVAVQSNQETQYQIRLFNTGAQAQANLKVRIFFDLTEVYAAGLTSSNVLVEKFFDQCSVTFGPVTVWNAAAKVYYVDVSWGAFSFPANSSCEIHVRPRLDGWQTVWNGANDYSSQGLTSTYATTQKIPAYQNNVRVYGTEPP